MSATMATSTFPRGRSVTHRQESLFGGPLLTSFATLDAAVCALGRRWPGCVVVTRHLHTTRAIHMVQWLPEGTRTTLVEEFTPGRWVVVQELPHGFETLIFTDEECT